MQLLSSQRGEPVKCGLYKLTSFQRVEYAKGEEKGIISQQRNLINTTQPGDEGQHQKLGHVDSMDP